MNKTKTKKLVTQLLLHHFVTEKRLFNQNIAADGMILLLLNLVSLCWLLAFIFKINLFYKSKWCMCDSTDKPTEADVWLLNSCTVKNPAEDHFRNSIRYWNNRTSPAHLTHTCVCVSSNLKLVKGVGSLAGAKWNICNIFNVKAE